MSKAKYNDLFSRIECLEVVDVEAQPFHKKLLTIKNDLIYIQNKTFGFLMSTSKIDKSITMLENYQVELEKLLVSKKNIVEEQAIIEKLKKQIQQSKTSIVYKDIDILQHFITEKQKQWRKEIYEMGFFCKDDKEISYEQAKLVILKRMILNFKNGLTEFKTAYENISEIGIKGMQEAPFYQAICDLNKQFITLFTENPNNSSNNSSFQDWLNEIQTEIQQLEPFIAKEPPKTLDDFYRTIERLQQWKRVNINNAEYSAQIERLITFKNSLSQNWRKIGEDTLNNQKKISNKLEQHIIDEAKNMRYEKFKNFNQKVTDLKSILGIYALNNIEVINQNLAFLEQTIKTDKSSKHRSWMKNFEQYESNFKGLITNNTYDIKKTLDLTLEQLETKIEQLNYCLLPKDAHQEIQKLKQEIAIQQNTNNPNQMLDFILNVKIYEHILSTYENESLERQQQLENNLIHFKQRLNQLKNYTDTDSEQVKNILRKVEQLTKMDKKISESVEKDSNLIQAEIEQLEDDIIKKCDIQYQSIQKKCHNKQKLLNIVKEVTRDKGIDKHYTQFKTIEEILTALDTIHAQKITLNKEIEMTFKQQEAACKSLLITFKKMNQKFLNVTQQIEVNEGINALHDFTNQSEVKITETTLHELYKVVVKYQSLYTTINAKKEKYDQSLKKLKEQLKQYNSQHLSHLLPETYIRIVGLIDGLITDPHDLSQAQVQCEEITQDFKKIEQYTQYLASQAAFKQIDKLRTKLSLSRDQDSQIMKQKRLLEEIDNHYTQNDFLPAHIRSQLRSIHSF